MKQILQNISNGETSLVDVPRPKIKQNGLLISSNCSVISTGTEKMLIDFGRGGYLEKAKQQPEKVRSVLDKIKTDGVIATYDAVKTKLDQPLPLGYSNAGIVIDSDNQAFNIGDRIVSNGFHAEVVSVGKNLCAKIPDQVDDETASFTVLGSIALESIRLINPSLGENVVVFGLGLIGLLSVQMLKANGCRVIAIDFNGERCSIAESFGAKSINLSTSKTPVEMVKQFTQDQGVDAAVIATATNSDEVIHQAASMCRKRGQIVLVGTSGLKLKREDFYEKELSFKVSCSYGPGRYDPLYEEQGIDYPYGYVRWTQQRNFEAVLDMMANGSVNVKSLISHRYPIDDAIDAYRQLDEPSTLGIVLEYPNERNDHKHLTSIDLNPKKARTFEPSKAVIGFIGAGNYASRVLIPAFKKSSAQLKTIVSEGGINSLHHGKKAGFNSASTDTEALLSDEEINTVVIATRHNLHARQVNKALEKGKNVFVEKPLAITIDDIEAIKSTYEVASKSSGVRLMIGFNRRFSPHITKMKNLLQPVASLQKSAVITVNAGKLPENHWLKDHKIGGGRIIGEACHFIDLITYLFDSPIKAFTTLTDADKENVSISLELDNGSSGVIHYLSNGGQSFAKERIEVFCNQGVLQLDNYRTLRGYDWPGFNRYKTLSQDKGQNHCVNLFLKSIADGTESPIPPDQIFHSSIISIQIANSLNK